MGAQVMDILANHNPAGFVARNNQTEAQNALLGAQAEQQRSLAQQEQLKTQLMQVDLRDQDILGRAFRDAAAQAPSPEHIPMLTKKLAIQYGISPKGYIGYQNSDMQLQQEYQKLANSKDEGDKLRLANEGTISERTGQVYNSLLAIPKEQRAQYIPGAVQQLKEHDPTHALPAPEQLLDDTYLNTRVAQSQYASGAIKAALEKAQTREAGAKADQSQAAAALDQAKTPGEQTKSEHEQLLLNTMKEFMANPMAGDSLIDKVIPPSLDPQANASYKTAFTNAMRLGGPPAAEQTIRAAAEHAGRITYATNQNVINADVKKHVAEVQATAGIEIGKAIATAKALRAGDNPAVAGVAPASIAAVQNAAMKLDSEYINARATTDAMGQLLDLAERGNKAAGSNLPLVGVETLNAINGIKRINTAEINQYGNAGSLLDQIKGKLDKLTEGKPIPQDVLNDIRTLHQTLGQEAYQKYTTGLSSLNQRTGSRYEPTVAAPDIQKKQSQQTAPALPMRLSQSDVGKVFTTRDGKRLKITAVNPQNPSQFRSEAQ